MFNSYKGTFRTTQACVSYKAIAITSSFYAEDNFKIILLIFIGKFT